MSGIHTSSVVALIAALVAQPALPAAAQDDPPVHLARDAQTPAQSVPDALARWLDAQMLDVAVRYDYIGDARDETLQNRAQTQVRIRGGLKADAAGRYTVRAGLSTGNDFNSGWNATGIGTGEGTATIYLTHLFLRAEVWRGIELEYGSLYPVRGQSTEITTYDDDAYITAGRVNLRRPREVFFDDVTVSVGYVGYFDTAFVFDRTGAFSRQNYWQVLVSKQLGAGFTVSTDYSAIEDDGMLRQGAAWRVDQPWIDRVIGEYGVRLRGGSHQTAFAITGEKEIAGVAIEAGYANVDPIFGVLNGDRYGPGNRVFTTVSLPLPFDLSASWFIQKEISPPITSSNDVRLDLALTWNVLKTLKRRGAVP